ncbi:MAG TPA: S49 family peptidase [Saprospiraceae bacterium]|nr:S49 family peptidase [Saprospiraceae bacterium]
MRDTLKFFIGKELFIDEYAALEYLLQYEQRVELWKGQGDSNAFAEAKQHSDQLTIISGDGTLAVTNFNKLPQNPQLDSIISFNVNDFMQSNDGLCSVGTKTMSDALLSYKNDPKVIGAKINFDTGGGEGMSGHILHNAFKEFGKPVIAYVYNAGSAGYLAASGATEIVAANENSRVGSIGALVSISKKMLDEYANNIVEIYSDSSSDKNKEFRALLKGDSDPLKEMLNKSVQVFHNVVKANRQLKFDPEGSLRGGMFFAKDAMKRGLLDHIGNNDFAISRVKKYAKK